MSSKGFNHCVTVADDRREPSLSINSIDTAHVINLWYCLKYILYTALQSKDIYFILIYFRQLRGRSPNHNEKRTHQTRGARNFKSFRGGYPPNGYRSPELQFSAPGKEIWPWQIIINQWSNNSFSCSNFNVIVFDYAEAKNVL